MLNYSHDKRKVPTVVTKRREREDYCRATAINGMGGGEITPVVVRAP